MNSKKSGIHHDEYNTFFMNIADDKDYQDWVKDLYRTSHGNAHHVDQYLSAYKDHYMSRLLEGFRLIALRLFGNPELLPTTTAWAALVRFYRSKSLETLLAFFVTLFPPEITLSKRLRPKPEPEFVDFKTSFLEFLGQHAVGHEASSRRCFYGDKSFTTIPPTSSTSPQCYPGQTKASPQHHERVVEIVGSSDDEEKQIIYTVESSSSNMSVIRKGEHSSSIPTDQQQSDSDNDSMDERQTTPDPASPKIPHGPLQPGQGEVNKHYFRYEPSHNYNYLPDDPDAESDISSEDGEDPLLSTDPQEWIRARFCESDDRFRVTELDQERENPGELDSNDELPTMDFSQYFEMEWFRQIDEFCYDTVVDRNGNHCRLSEVQQNAADPDSSNEGQKNKATTDVQAKTLEQHFAPLHACEEKVESPEAGAPRAVTGCGPFTGSDEHSNGNNVYTSNDDGNGSRGSDGNHHNQAHGQDAGTDIGGKTDKDAYQAALEGPAPSRKRLRSLTPESDEEEERSSKRPRKNRIYKGTADVTPVPRSKIHPNRKRLSSPAKDVITEADPASTNASEVALVPSLLPTPPPSSPAVQKKRKREADDGAEEDDGRPQKLNRGVFYRCR